METVYLGPKSKDAVFVAEDDSTGRIVGFAICGQDRDHDSTYQGEVIGLYILQESQRRGLGRQLMLSALKELQSRGFDSLIVWVLADYRSRGFYRTPIRTQATLTLGRS
jgi:ribosomal protein S18 acetylase RimI-like enzyme